jgi:hypothetical protein
MRYQISENEPKYQHDVKVPCIPDPHGDEVARNRALRLSMLDAMSKFPAFLKGIGCNEEYQRQVLRRLVALFKISIEDQRAFTLEPCKTEEWMAWSDSE